jgi:alkylated DNA repair dioxygenase AlkB/lysophospholipase L1-like esterase
MNRSITETLLSLDISQLKEARQLIDELLKSKVNRNSVNNPAVVDSNANINDYVEYCEQFVSTNDKELLMGEIESLNLKCPSTSPNKVTNAFISLSKESYSWMAGNSQVVNTPLDLVDFPVLKSVLEKVNLTAGGEVNSVLVSKLSNGNAAVRLHDDDEVSMDPRQPICVVSLGAKRNVEFVAKGGDYRATCLSLTPDDRSMYVMKPGCQTHFLHRVRKDKRVKEVRYSLSFRSFIPESEQKTVKLSTPSPVKNLIDKFERPENFMTPGPTTPIPDALGSVKSLPAKSTSTPWDSSMSLDKATPGFSPYPVHDTFLSNSISPTRDEKYCVIFGTSITERIDGEQMSRGSRRVINRSINGAKIGDVKEEIRDFCIENPGVTSKVDKVILCLGTNDIKHFNSFQFDLFKRFRSPLTQLIRQAKFMFPNAQIIFKSVLPFQIRFKYNPKSVQEFNYLLLELCSNYGCIFFDCFAEFLDANGVDYNGYLYSNWLHLNDNGLKVLCRAIKFVIYQNVFNPYMSVTNCSRYY